jgi:hypothetical protein
MHTGFWWESPEERDSMEDRGADAEMELKWNLKRFPAGGWGVWSGFARFRKQTCGGFSRM